MNAAGEWPTPPGNEPRSRDYRSFATISDNTGLLDTTIDQVATWLRVDKGTDLDLTSSGVHAVDGRALTVRHRRASHQTGFRLLIEEDNSGGHWTTRVTAVEDDHGSGWVSIDVISGARRYAGTPRIARYLIDALPLIDAGLQLRTSPTVIRGEADRVEDLVRLVLDPRRRMPVYVAGTDERLDSMTGQWAEKIEKWTSDVHGLGHVFVLGPAATSVLAERVGVSWSAPPWAVRTYMPGLADFSLDTPWRHRTLGTTRLTGQSDGATRVLLGGVARNLTAVQPPPQVAVTWKRAFDRVETRLLTEAIDAELDSIARSRPVPVTEPETPTGLVERATSDVGELEVVFLRIQDALGVPSLDDATLRDLARRAARDDAEVLARSRSQITSMENRIETLEDERNENREALELAQVELLESQEEMSTLRDRSSWLGKQLSAAGNHEAAFGVVPDDAMTEYPASYTDLYERASAMAESGIFLTADRATVCALDDLDTNGLTVRHAWDAILTLVDYRRARTDGVHQGDLWAYISAPPPGCRSVARKKFAARESAPTMGQYGDQRVFAVPFDVDPSGSKAMEAHFKLGRLGMKSPRLHFWDDVGTSGQIVVGYIGAHLRTVGTN